MTTEYGLLKCNVYNLVDEKKERRRNYDKGNAKKQKNHSIGSS